LQLLGGKCGVKARRAVTDRKKKDRVCWMSCFWGLWHVVVERRKGGQDPPKRRGGRSDLGLSFKRRATLRVEEERFRRKGGGGMAPG